MQHKATIFYEWEQGKSAYNFPFPYLSKQFVKVRVDHANTSTLLEYNRDYTIEGQTLTLTPVHPFVSGATLCIYRQTPTGSLVDFSDGSILLASELDKMSIQLLHITEEQNDILHLEGMFVSEGAWQAQGRRIKNVAAPVEATDAVHLAYLDGLGIARQSELQRIETLVSEKERQAAESARESKEAATQSAQQFTQTIEARFQTLTTLLQQKLSAEYVPHTQGVEMLTTISNASIAILQRSRAYQVGDIAYHKALPSWARLECVKAGITGAALPTQIEQMVQNVGVMITDGTVVWIIDDLRDGTPVGAVRGSLYLSAGYVKANGATVQRADYPRLVALADKHNLWTDDTAANAGLFGRGDGAATMVLPNWTDRMVQLAGDGAGASVAAGLPNITGVLKYRYSAIYSSEGSFAQGRARENSVNLAFSDSSTGLTASFDASRSNPIYGASSTVQPPAIALIAQIKY